MASFRFIFGGLLLAAMFCFGASLITYNPAWRRRGIVILKWTLAAVVIFFAVLLWQRPLAL